MSFDIDNAFVQQFSNNVTHLVQQRGSVLRGAVRTDMQTGKTAFVDQIGGTEPVRRSARHADTPLIATPHSRRRITLVDYEWADLIDDQDKVRLLAEMEGPYATNAAWAMGRAMDDEIIAAALGTAYTGEEGTTTVALPAAQKVLADSAGLTLPKLREARRILRANDVPEDEELFIAVTAEQLDDLLATTEVTSQDFNSVKALVDGAVNRFMGFTFLHTERLTTDGNDDRQVIAWAKTGLQLNIAAEPKARIMERPDKSHATQVYFAMSLGATRLEEEKVVEIACVEV